MGRSGLILSALIVATQVAGAASEPTAMAADMDALGKSMQAVAVDLYAYADKGRDNFVFSPLSMTMGLGMVYAGARGETERQLAGALQTQLPQERYHVALDGIVKRSYDTLKQSGARLDIAKLLVVQQGFQVEPNYQSLIRNQYGAGVLEVDFRDMPRGAALQINKWVSTRTRNRIPRLVEPDTLDHHTVAALVNALSFRCPWASDFEPLTTGEKPFWITLEQEVPVKMMQQTGSFAYGENGDVQVVEIPYKGGGMGMVIVLPHLQTGLPLVEASLDKDVLSSWQSLLADGADTRVALSLPRFKIEQTVEMKAAVVSTGAQDMFSIARADLGGITKQQQLYISAILHRAGIKADEKGTEAWVATAAEIALTEEPEPEVDAPKAFTADHPFLFLIRDRRTNTILFMGRVNNPAI